MQKTQEELSLNNEETAKDTWKKQEKNKCRSQERVLTGGKKQSVVANAVEKKTQIITEASIVFSNMKVIISDSVNIFNRIQQKMTSKNGKLSYFLLLGDSW